MRIRNTLTLVGLIAFLSGLAQPTFHKDAFGDMHNTATGWVQHKGQKLGTDLQPAQHLQAYGEGYGMDIWLMERSRFKLSKTIRDTIPLNNDTTFAISIAAVGAMVTPEHFLPLPGHSNFYYPHTGTNVENVRSHHRVVYWNVWQNTSMQFYTSRGGPKLSFVCEPGSNPADILLKCDGQDSLHIDINGFLKMYMRGRSLVLSQAVAYQINAQGNVVFTTWFPTYNLIDTSGYVSFNFGSYDTTRPLILQIGAPAQGDWEPDEPRNMLWSTYAGSNNSDEFMATDADANGDVYVTGYTYEANFPVGTGYQVHTPFQPAFAGSEDIVTMKFAASDKQIQWATYHGGSGSSTGPEDEWRGLDKAYDMVVYKGTTSSLEYVFITGSTINTDFPTLRRTSSPFINADLTPFVGGSNNAQRAAFISAYKQYDGRLDWSTTMGTTNTDMWQADGLGVDILNDGTLVWCGRVTELTQNSTYPLVTPTGAFTRPHGGGFFILFNSAYQIIWSTTFGAQCEVAGAFDVKMARVGSSDQRKAYFTGITCDNPPLLDVYQAPGENGFYQPTYGGGQRDAYIAVLNLDTYQLEYCTHWGGNGDDQGIALEVLSTQPHNYKQVWVGGLSKSTDLNSSQLPAPGAGGLHQTTNGGNADAFLLSFNAFPEMNLIYGTLYGGAGNDAILDLDAGKDGSSVFGADQIYATGETGSASDIILLDNAALYQQDQLGNTTGSSARDAFLLCLNIYDRQPIWTTYLGGAHTDKGWGVAATDNELFLVGGTVSDQGTFPLKEFDPNAPQDWYDGDITNNTGNWFIGHYSFNNQHFYKPFAFQLESTELPPGRAHDAFIASFGISPTVTVREHTRPGFPAPILISADGLWSIILPEQVHVLRIFDAGGRLIEERSTLSLSGQVLIDLRQRPSGIYAITCITEQGAAHGTKLFKP